MQLEIMFVFLSVVVLINHYYLIYVLTVVYRHTMLCRHDYEIERGGG